MTRVILAVLAFLSGDWGPSPESPVKSKRYWPGTLPALSLLARREWAEQRGRLSYYWPGDSMRTGRELACSSRRRRRYYEPGSVHVALRAWSVLGCGTRVVVCAEATRRCAVAPVYDSGPWGVIRGPLRRAVKEGRWRVWTKRTPPKGWRFRAVVDLSRALWVRLGKPRGLSRVRVYVPWSKL